MTASFMDIKAALFGRPTSVQKHDWPGWLPPYWNKAKVDENCKSKSFVFKERIQMVKMRNIREKSAHNLAYLERKMAKK